MLGEAVAERRPRECRGILEEEMRVFEGGEAVHEALHVGFVDGGTGGVECFVLIDWAVGVDVGVAITIAAAAAAGILRAWSTAVAWNGGVELWGECAVVLRWWSELWRWTEGDVVVVRLELWVVLVFRQKHERVELFARQLG